MKSIVIDSGRTGSVRWERFEESRIINSGRILMSDVDMMVHRQGRRAEDEMMRGGFDHIIYAAKIYGADNRLKVLQLYMLALDDDRFMMLTKKLGNSMIYAIHRRNGR